MCYSLAKTDNLADLETFVTATNHANIEEVRVYYCGCVDAWLELSVGCWWRRWVIAVRTKVCTKQPSSYSWPSTTTRVSPCASSSWKTIKAPPTLPRSLARSRAIKKWVVRRCCTTVDAHLRVCVCVCVQVCFACVDAEEFKIAQQCGLFVIVEADELEDLVYHYEVRLHSLFTFISMCVCIHVGLCVASRRVCARDCVVGDWHHQRRCTQRHVHRVGHSLLQVCLCACVYLFFVG